MNLMTSGLAAKPGLLGVQEPRLCLIPEYASSAGEEAVELAALAGLYLDPWQAFVLKHSLGERPDGKWAAPEVGLVLPRQNGKDAVLEARELAGLFILGERLIIHSAHQFDTSLEHFRRLRDLIEDTPELSKRLKPRGVKNSHGEEGIELKGGQRIRFKARTKGGARGFSGDCIIFNEAMELPEAAISAMFFTKSARPNAQVWYAGSSVDEEVHDHGVALARVRERGIEGSDPALAYFEWSADAELVDAPLVADKPEVWARANPGLGIRISTETVEQELRSVSDRSFAVERLGIGAWPATDGSGDRVLDLVQWAGLKDEKSEMRDPVCFAVDVSEDRKTAAVSAAGLRSDGLAHVEVVDHRPGTGWVVSRVVELVTTHANVGVCVAKTGPASSLIPDLEEAGIEVVPLSETEHAQACGHFYDAVDQGALRHLGQRNLDSAVRGGVKRPMGDSWAWSRKNSGVDISPLVACTFARWGVETRMLVDVAANVW